MAYAQNCTFYVTFCIYTYLHKLPKTCTAYLLRNLQKEVSRFNSFKSMRNMKAWVNFLIACLRQFYLRKGRMLDKTSAEKHGLVWLELQGWKRSDWFWNTSSTSLLWASQGRSVGSTPCVHQFTVTGCHKMSIGSRCRCINNATYISLLQHFL